MPKYRLAQMNIAQLIDRFGDPELADFVARLEDINALADKSPGFVWRRQTEDADAPAGGIPSNEEAGERLADLRTAGPNPRAFGCKQMCEPG